MAKLPKPPFPLPIPAPETTEDALAQVIDLTEAVDGTKPSGTAPFTVGLFSDEHGLLAGATAARAAGLTNLQAWSPFPVHGLDPVLGLQRSLIGRPVFTVALLGFLFTFIGIAWLMVGDWAVIYGGKPYFTWQLWVVPTLETGLLLAAVVNLKACFAACKLIPDPFTQLPDVRVTDDQFALAIGGIPTAEAEALLRQAGATAISTTSAAVASGNPIFQPLASEAPAHA
jgi:hypothetical protein